MIMLPVRDTHLTSVQQQQRRKRSTAEVSAASARKTFLRHQRAAAAAAAAPVTLRALPWHKRCPGIRTSMNGQWRSLHTAC
jgi:hypothetical protein